MVIICVALEKELPNQFKKWYPKHWVRIEALQAGALHHYQDASFLIVITGVGEKSKLAIEWLIQNAKPTEIINFGTAGAASLDLHQWVMLKSTSDGHTICDCDLKTSLPIPYHQFNFSDGRTVNDPDVSITDAVVDMEAHHLATACRNANIPFCAIKYITDHNNNESQTDFNASLDQFHQSLMGLFSCLVLPEFNIAVIIPTYNRHEQTKAALESVLQQHTSPNEIIIVDDGSDVPFEYSHTKVKLLRLNKNHGVSHARNIGIQNSSSVWVAFLDSDDVWHPTHLSSLTAYLEENTLCRLLQTDETWIRNGKPFNKKAYHQKPDGWSFEPSLQRCLLSPSAVMIHRSLFDWHGNFDESLTVCEDYDLWLRFLRYVPVGLVPVISMTKFGGHDDQLSTTLPAMDNFRLTALMKQWENRWPNIDRTQLRDVIKKKCEILIQGATKRDLSVDWYEQLLEKII
ncbi:hypothetical protein DID73_01655 [Candidatus Marinamargulisbacteria bacterium SCGC AG-343-K17]|nr:hypothetical protein DID73_01655 [Candidatus Marinamargulisbacteria bacterium SCGC AG-343-K17]